MLQHVSQNDTLFSYVPATHDRVKKVPELVIRVVVLLLVAAAANAVDAAVGPSNATEKCGQNPL